MTFAKSEYSIGTFVRARDYSKAANKGFVIGDIVMIDFGFLKAHMYNKGFQNFIQGCLQKFILVEQLYLPSCWHDF